MKEAPQTVDATMKYRHIKSKQSLYRNYLELWRCPHCGQEFFLWKEVYYDQEKNILIHRACGTKLEPKPMGHHYGKPSKLNAVNEKR